MVKINAMVFEIFHSKFKIRQMGGSRKPSVNVIVIFLVII